MYRKSQGPARAGGDLLLDLSAIRDTFVFEGSGDFYLPFLVEAIPSGAGDNPAPALGATITAALEFHYPDARRRNLESEITADIYDVQDFFSTWRIGATEDHLNEVDFATFEESFLPNAFELNPNIVFGQPFFNGNDGEADNVVFVHGWNMDSGSKRSFAETMYKRLYWQGFAGRFYSFEWPTFVDEEGPLPISIANLTYSPTPSTGSRASRFSTRIRKSPPSRSRTRTTTQARGRARTTGRRE